MSTVSKMEDAVEATFDSGDEMGPEADPAQVDLLLDAEGALTPKFEAILRRIFLLHASPTSNSAKTSTASASTSDKNYDVFSNERTLNRQDCDKFAEATNGHPMTEETWTEICDFFDVVESEKEETKSAEEAEDVVKEALADEAPSHAMARLTFKGFLQLYQLQTENDATETINDLVSWGYQLDTEKQSIELVATRKESEKEVDALEGEGVKKEDLTGVGLGGEKKEK